MLKFVCLTFAFVAAVADAAHIQPHLRPHETLLEKLVDQDENGDDRVRIDEDDNNVEGSECLVGGEIKPLGTRTLYKHYSHVFPSKEMTCDGNITAWEFFARSKGIFFASVWREEGIGHYTLIGKNWVNATTVGKQVHVVPPEGQIQVRKGDVIGVHPPRKHARGQRDGVVAYENQLLEGRGCGELELTWMRQHSQNWERNADVRFDLMAYRRVAIRANVQAPADQPV